MPNLRKTSFAWYSCRFIAFVGWLLASRVFSRKASVLESRAPNARNPSLVGAIQAVRVAHLHRPGSPQLADAGQRRATRYRTERSRLARDRARQSLSPARAPGA